jgi:hypothetical protein
MRRAFAPGAAIAAESNVTLVDRHGATATVELLTGGTGSAQLIGEASL